MKPVTLASIDIGSNGARLLIKRFDEDAPEFERIRKVMFVRVPLRLGEDVFTLNKISKERQNMTLLMLKGFRQFMRLHNVKEYRACATSAMRDAENGKKLMKRIERETGIRLEIIPGAEEAQLLCNNLVENTECSIGNYAFVDVGGGSTEISLLHDGVLTESHSFNIGTLRLLNHKVKPSEKDAMRKMLQEYSAKYPGTKILGSGGNINRLFKLVKEKGDTNVLKVSKLKEIYATLAPLSVDERKERFALKDDRADVIVPAAETFLAVADALQCQEILVPNISLADSIVDGLYRKVQEDEKNESLKAEEKKLRDAEKQKAKNTKEAEKEEKKAKAKEEKAKAKEKAKEAKPKEAKEAKPEPKKAAEAPKAEAPKAETPKAEAPKKSETPKAEVKKTEAPKAEAPKKAEVKKAASPAKAKKPAASKTAAKKPAAKKPAAPKKTASKKPDAK